MASKVDTLELMRKLGSNETKPEDLTDEERQAVQDHQDNEARAEEGKNTKQFSKKLLSKLPNPFAKEQ